MNPANLQSLPKVSFLHQNELLATFFRNFDKFSEGVPFIVEGRKRRPIPDRHAPHESICTTGSDHQAARTQDFLLLTVQPLTSSHKFFPSFFAQFTQHRPNYREALCFTRSRRTDELGCRKSQTSIAAHPAFRCRERTDTNSQKLTSISSGPDFLTGGSHGRSPSQAPCQIPNSCSAVSVRGE